MSRLSRKGDLSSRRAAPRRGRPAGDDGSGTVLLLGLVCVVALMATFLGLLASAQAARGRAQAAADLSALAAASRLLPLGGGDPCGIAAQTASRNRALLATCEDQGAGVVLVRVVVPTRVGPASAEASAGPTSARG